MVTVAQIQNGLATFMDAELMPKLPATGIQKVITGTAVALLIRRSGATIQEYSQHPFIKMLGIVDEKGNFDIDTLKTEVKKQMGDQGFDLDVPMIGTMTFHSADIDKIASYIKSAEGGIQ